MTNITRRAALGGIVLLPASAGVCAVEPENIGRRFTAMAEEVSRLLHQDGGHWWMRIHPMLEGRPIVSVQPFEPFVPEHPWDRARRLSWELSSVLAEDLGDGASPASKWYAVIQPDSGGLDVQFSSIKARDYRRAMQSQGRRS